MDKDTVKALHLINDILMDLIILSGYSSGPGLIRWKDSMTIKRNDLSKIIKDNEERLRIKK